MISNKISNKASFSRRSALIIGNNDYEKLPRLKNAINDAKFLADKLTAAGYDDVDLRINVRITEFNRHFLTFRNRLTENSLGVFWFSGHGVQYKSNNYLVPVNTEINDHTDLAESTIGIHSLFSRLNRTSHSAVVMFIDACRNEISASTSYRNAHSHVGLSQDNHHTPDGLYVVYAAGHNEFALDNLGINDPVKHSVFAREIIPRITAPGADLDKACKQAKRAVRELAAQRTDSQNPAYYNQLSDDISLVDFPESIWKMRFVTAIHFGDYHKVREYFEEHARLNESSAMVALGMLCRKGRGGPIDNDQAIEWYEKAAALNDRRARRIILKYQKIREATLRAREALRLAEEKRRLEQEAAGRAAAEKRRLEQEAAARAAAEKRRLEQEAAARASAEKQRLEQEAAARAASEKQRLEQEPTKHHIPVDDLEMRRYNAKQMLIRSSFKIDQYNYNRLLALANTDIDKAEQQIQEMIAQHKVIIQKDGIAHSGFATTAEINNNKLIIAETTAAARSQPSKYENAVFGMFLIIVLTVVSSVVSGIVYLLNGSTITFLFAALIVVPMALFIWELAASEENGVFTPFMRKSAFLVSTSYVSGLISSGILYSFFMEQNLILNSTLSFILTSWIIGGMYLSFKDTNHSDRNFFGLKYANRFNILIALIYPSAGGVISMYSENINAFGYLSAIVLPVALSIICCICKTGQRSERYISRMAFLLLAAGLMFSVYIMTFMKSDVTHFIFAAWYLFVSIITSYVLSTLPKSAE